MPCVRLARNAMATRFELALHGDDPTRLRAAGEQALAEIDRLENQLSLYRAHSEIAQLNQRAANEPVRVTPALFALLRQAQRISTETQGAFDITIAPLVRCWGFMNGTGQLPDENSLAEARSKTGMSLVQLDESAGTVRFLRAGVMLDLGAIGKGYAIDQAADVLREAGITSALLHGGTSSVYAIGRPPEADSWNVVIEHPGDPAAPPVATVSLKDESLSVSAVWGKSFSSGGQTYGHVLDPRTGRPTSAALLAAIVLPSATETDALSTALLTLGPSGVSQICTWRPEARALVLYESEGGLSCESRAFNCSLKTQAVTAIIH